MPKLRLLSRSRRGGRWLALAAAVAVVATPGMARADTPSLPVSPSDLPSQMQFSPECPTAIAGDLTKLLTDIANPAQLTNLINTLTGALSSPPSPSELLALLEALGLGSSSPGGGTTASAATTTTAATTSDSNPLSDVDLPIPTTLPTTTSAATTTTSAATTTSSAAPDPTADLTKLVTDFFTYCIPAPPSLPSAPTSSSGAAAPVGQEQPQTQAVSTPGTQPVTYPGYAGTGGLATTALRPASDQRPSPAVPLAVLGGVLLVSIAATAAGVRSRARRHGR